jgi:RNA polymerase sigma factor (TIGR02999 family)
MPDVTQILNAIDAGDRRAADQLMPLVYDELRKLAAVKMAQERPDHSLNATALVHEAYLRLVGNQRFDNRGHFFAAAAEAMRRILVDRARERHSLKRGGAMDRVPLSDFANADPDERLLHLDEALTRLAACDPLAAKAVELHHFAGLTQEEAAAALGISDYQFRQKWSFARAWLKAELSDS